ncbi:hypothetical protein [Maribacter sp.]|uniref:hypothetical protein n=1 Tax=Maribacter sp. TaxID=1897614 RepID=UPI0025C369E8|nr:hypothetical protein [Maribacter sp.]
MGHTNTGSYLRKSISKMHLSKLNLDSKTYLEIGYSNFYKDTRDWVLVHTQFRATEKKMQQTKKILKIEEWNL